MAALWCEYLEAHARRIYAPAIRPDIHAANALVKKITEGKIKDKDSVRDIYRPQWSSLRTPGMVNMGLQLLENLNWLKVELTVGSGRPSEIVHLHPELRT